jgi:hypothetical protein
MRYATELSGTRRPACVSAIAARDQSSAGIAPRRSPQAIIVRRHRAESPGPALAHARRVQLRSATLATSFAIHR